MRIQIETKITLDPVTEHAIIQNYNNDPGWIKGKSDTTKAVFVHLIDVTAGASYIPAEGEKHE